MSLVSAPKLWQEPEYRVEGPLKVTGQARYSADMRLPGMLWADFLGSPHPHARIVSIDVTAARAVPGVAAVLTGADTRPARFGRMLQDWPVLADERVRFIGDRVAAVAAETPEAAAEAVRRIEVEYEELPALLNFEEALSDGAPILHPDATGYAYLAGKRPSMPHPNIQGRLVRVTGNGDLEAAFARADRVYEHVFRTPREHGGYIEPRAALVWIDQTHKLHVVSTNKGPFGLRRQISVSTGVPEEHIVIEPSFIGGDFGAKGLSVDEFVCYFLAKATDRPIKAVMTYASDMQATNVRHATVVRLRTGVDRDGRFVAHDASLLFDGGAYAAGKPLPPLILIGGVETFGPYHVPNARIELTAVYSNTVPGGHMRAPGEVQAQFAGESQVDIIAQHLGIDPLEFRLRNAVRPGQVSASNERIRAPRALEVLETLRREARWSEQPREPHRGRGIALGVRQIIHGKTSLVVQLRPDGGIEVLTGVPDQGSGGHTVIQRVAAAVLSIPRELITVRRGNTDQALPDPGVGGSWVTNFTGQATRVGSERLKQRLEDLASETMGWPAGQVRLEDGFFNLEGGEQRVPFADVAKRIASGPPVAEEGTYDSAAGGGEEIDANFAAYMVDAEVDPETGATTIHDIVLAMDVGAIVNPTAHQGQLDGSLMFGIGAALMEEMTVADGKIATPNLSEYKIPTQGDTPPFRTVLLPAADGPGAFGTKSVAEVSNGTVAPALANAIAAALGVRVMELPLTAERVLEALRERAS